MDETFIRAAVDQAELNALRVALYQATGDPAIAAIPLEIRSVRGGAGTLPVVPEEHHDRLKEAAVRFLLDEAADHTPRTPGRDEIDALIRMAHSEPVSDEALTARRDLLAFGEFPRQLPRPEGLRVPPGFHVIIVGSGFSGIAMGVQLELLGIPYTVLERRHEAGGVWSTNTYPDARVDTLSATYQFSFEKNYPWSEHFARQPEVREYLDFVSRKHGVHARTRFGHDVVAAEWDDDTSTWALRVRTADGAEHPFRASVLVSAAGLFAVPREIDIPGADDFDGEILHTTAWSADRSARGKRVAVVGNGSTGVQLLARVAEDAAHVTVFQRTPQWISPRERYGEPVDPGSRWLLDTMPHYWNWSRYVAIMPLLDAYELLVPDEAWIAAGGQVNERSDLLRARLVDYIRSQVGDRPDLLAELVPGYAPIARRPVVDNGWYRALTRDDVELVTAPIERITPGGIRTGDGREHELDMIIAAIGFQTGRYLWPTDYRGRGGIPLHEKWAETGAEAYTGMTIPGFPNFFVLYGPNSQPVSGGNTLPMWFEVWACYIAQCLVAMFERGASQIEVRKDVCDDYNRRLQDLAGQLIYLTDTGSRDVNYYVNEHGKLSSNVPWDFEEYYRISAAPDLDDFDLR